MLYAPLYGGLAECASSQSGLHNTIGFTGVGEACLESNKLKHSKPHDFFNFPHIYLYNPSTFRKPIPLGIISKVLMEISAVKKSKLAMSRCVPKWLGRLESKRVSRERSV